jgi:esterase FrsA
VNDIGELKKYVRIHARTQRIPRAQELLDRIHTDDGPGPGSWVREWCHAAERLEQRGNDLAAARHYALARFPYVDGPARQQAQDRCVRTLDRWRSGRPGIEPLEADLEGGRVRGWSSGLSTSDRKPLLVVLGGIVTVKEQWAPMLAGVPRLGMAAVVTEMPGVGENEQRYQPESWRMISGLLDELADRADVERTYAIALSFGGHLALRCAVDDHRIRGVVTAGAPVGAFFTDEAWQRRLPQITVDTLAHLTGTTPAGVAGSLDDWALSPEQLAALDIPVSYGASLRDEIIPPGEVGLLRRHVRRLDIVQNDDVHGSPRYAAEMQLWAISSLLRARGVRGPQSALVGLLRHGQRARRRLAGLRRGAG